jgi:hypothetical protein
VEKAGPKIVATSVFFKTLPKVNLWSIGENSPNLVTQMHTYTYIGRGSNNKFNNRTPDFIENQIWLFFQNRYSDNKSV